MTATQSIRFRVAWLLDYEPTWFPEFGSGLGVLLWSAGALLTDDLSVHGTAVLLPVIGVVFGPIRWVLLLRLWYGPRVLASMASGAFWAWIICGLSARFGIVPMLGAAIGLFTMDVLTTARFSVPCMRDLIGEWRAKCDHE